MEEPRQRATAIVIRDDSLLIVKDSRLRSYSLPGGGIDTVELPISAVARELHEETSLLARKISYLFTFRGKHNEHHVYRVDADGDVKINGEIEDFMWWDRQSRVPIFPHVLDIISKL